MAKKQENKTSDAMEVDLMLYMRKLWHSRKFLLKVIVVGAILGLIVAFSLPSVYRVEVTLAPESGKGGGSEISSMASMLGLGSMAGGANADALTVSLFPDIVKSTPFILELFDIHVKTSKDSLDQTLVSYLKQEKIPWWKFLSSLPGKAIHGVISLYSDKQKEESDSIDAFHLTGTQLRVISKLRTSIAVSVDKKTGMTNVAVTLQDPLATAIVADSVVAKLQKYITSYRASKAQQDCDYLDQLYKERQEEYYQAQQSYANYMDANKNVILQRVLTEGERLQNEMSLAFQVYSQVATQLQVARAKVQEAKPVFVVVEPASVPLSPAGTSKKVILIGFIFLAVVMASVWLFGRELWADLKKELNKPSEDNL